VVGLRLVPADNATGFKGVSRVHFKGVTRDRGKFQARATEGGKQMHLGLFSTPEAAALAYARHKAATPPTAPQPQPAEADDDQASNVEADSRA
jgi:hypothetical protein